MGLRKELNVWGMTMIVIGSCIGSGIFLTPGEGMAAVGHQGWLLMIWAIARQVILLRKPKNYC